LLDKEKELSVQREREAAEAYEKERQANVRLQLSETLLKKKSEEYRQLAHECQLKENQVCFLFFFFFTLSLSYLSFSIPINQSNRKLTGKSVFLVYISFFNIMFFNYQISCCFCFVMFSCFTVAARTSTS
jgi:hypothetical protein